MLMRFTKVSRDGTFSRPPMDKLVLFPRQFSLELCCDGSLAIATTIGTRFSAAQVKGTTIKGELETPVLNYEN
ncbi:hypothetical protein AC1031_020624 [Aphanomyces cochlioides]|nr:hypothetical protein AC1031_020624 [Aphanomyces cochlioides]